MGRRKCTLEAMGELGMNRVLVTGANGFVGSALCNRLAKNGIKTIAIVKDENSDISRLVENDNLTIRYCNMNNFRNLADITDGLKIDLLYHFAWTGSAGELRKNYEIQTNNVRYTCDAVMACKEMQCERFVYASSIMKYEIQNAEKTGNALPAVTIYSSAKSAADSMARAVAGSIGVEYISGVISNVYGPGEYSARLINSSIRKLIKGEHCSFSNGEQLYDFIYVDDAARAFELLGQRGKNNRSYYIGDRPQKLKNYLIEMKNAINTEAELGLGELPSPTTTLNYDEFDYTVMKHEFGFEPKVSFREGIIKTAEWVKNSENIRLLEGL